MRVKLEFDLQEDVTPEIFAAKVALALSKEGCLRKNESVISEHSDPIFKNKHTLKGFSKTTLGGIVKEPILYPDIKSTYDDWFGS